MTNNISEQQNSNNNMNVVQPNAVAAASEISNSNNKIDEVQQRIRENKIMFYGSPILIIGYAFSIFFFFIVPTFQKFFIIQEENKVLDQNITNVNQTAYNLNQAVSDTVKIDDYGTQLSEFIPSEARVGQLISIIQKQANDFGLEKQQIATIDLNSNPKQTSVGSLAQTDSSSNSLFQTINSGEIEFTPKSITSDAKTKLLAIDVSVNGKRENFLKFLETLKSVKPKINLVSIDYQESMLKDNVAYVSANLRLESYAMKVSNSKVTNPRKYTISDSILIKSIPVETFIINSEIEKILTPTTTP